MMKKLIFFGLFLIIQNGYSCPESLPTHDERFCPSFKLAALCHCSQSGLPKGFCNNVSSVYRRMVSFFGTLERACNHQGYTDAQTCMDNWSCYLNGGYDSEGRPCSGTTKACESNIK